MNVKFTSKIAMTSNGIAFQDGITYDINEEEAKRLVKTFPNKFRLAPEAAPQEVKPEAVEPETKPKAVAKPKPKTSKPRRTISKED